MARWIQKANRSIKRRGTKGVCTGTKFGGPTCRPGTKRYNLAKTFKKMAKKRKNMATGGVSEPYIGSYVHGNLGGTEVANPSYGKYYNHPGFKMGKM